MVNSEFSDPFQTFVSTMPVTNDAPDMVAAVEQAFPELATQQALATLNLLSFSCVACCIVMFGLAVIMVAIVVNLLIPLAEAVGVIAALAEFLGMTSEGVLTYVPRLAAAAYRGTSALALLICGLSNNC